MSRSFVKEASLSGGRRAGPWVATGTVDLTRPEDAILRSFSANTRRQIRLAHEKGVVFRAGANATEALDFFNVLQHMHAHRGLFLVTRREFRALFDHVFSAPNLGCLIIGTCEGTLLGGIGLFRDGRGLYGYRYAVTTHLPHHIATLRIGAGLWWAGMRWGKQHGCQWFDVEGYEPTVDPGAPTYHVHVFKGGFRPTATRLLGEYTYVCNRSLKLIALGVSAASRAVRLLRSAPYQLRTRGLWSRRDKSRGLATIHKK